MIHKVYFLFFEFCLTTPPPLSSPQPNFLKLWIELFNSFHVPVSSRLPRRTSHQSSYWNSPPTETVWCRTDSNLTAAVVVVGWVGPPYNLLSTTTFPENWVKPQLSGSLSCLKIFQFSLKISKALAKNSRNLNKLPETIIKGISEN